MTTDPKTDGELQSGEYVATPEELQAIDAAIASIDAGETVSAAEIKAVFARYRRTLPPDMKNDIFQQ
jgi:predicted transcriptional regulator